MTLDTKLVGLIGKPLKQSFSQRMHNAAFQERGINFFFLPSEIEEEGVGPVLNGLRHMNYVGLSVTKPYKITVMPYLDEIDESAAMAGAVNTIVIRDKKLIGYNTDGEGFLKSLVDETGIILQENVFFMSGAGGAARAICVALAYHKPKRMYIVGRRDVNSSRLTEELNKKFGDCAVHVPSGDGQKLKAALAESQVFINGSGLGMYPHLEESPIPKEYLRSDLIVCDLTYNPLKTRLLQDATEVGCPTVNGMGMLVNQGVKAFELWTGVEAPEEVMGEMVSQVIQG